jgi:hypothetical protein
MKFLATALTTGLLATITSVLAETTTTIDHLDNDDATASFAFKSVPPPSTNDAATSARFSIVDGEADPNSGSLDKLHDGGLPEEADQPEENFFFAAGSDGGRLKVDLGRAIDIRQVNTYSWHPETRAPQSYRLYASDGTAANFNAAPAKPAAPDQCGWTLLASVKTQPDGGQFGVSIANPPGNLGKFRYLLFDILATEHDDAFGNTFFSEIDVVDADATVPPGAVAVTASAFNIQTADGKCTIAINTKHAPELKGWAEAKLAPALAEWYPKIVAELASTGFAAPGRFNVTIKPMDGVAFTSGTQVVANSKWLESELNGEAVGSLIHEEAHVVQQFGYGRHRPVWLVEGTADYVRWFIYEPQSHGADIVWMKGLGKRFSPRYNASYRTTANFLNWVANKYDRNIVGQMNAAMRNNTYDDGLWEKYTGKTAPELGDEWKKEILAQLAVTNSIPAQN